MKTVLASLGAFALNFVLGIAWLLLVALVLWALVPAAFLVAVTYPQMICLSALLFLARGVFK